MKKVASKRRIFVLILLIFVLVILGIVLILCDLLRSPEGAIERRFKQIAETRLGEEGYCVIDLAEAFNDIEWDSATIFEAGTSSEMEALFGVFTSGETGIVFSLDGEPVVYDLAICDDDLWIWYDPDFEYCIYANETSDVPYRTMPKEDAHVYVIKHSWGLSVSPDLPAPDDIL